MRVRDFNELLHELVDEDIDARLRLWETDRITICSAVKSLCNSETPFDHVLSYVYGLKSGHGNTRFLCSAIKSLTRDHMPIQSVTGPEGILYAIQYMFNDRDVVNERVLNPRGMRFDGFNAAIFKSLCAVKAARSQGNIVVLDHDDTILTRDPIVLGEIVDVLNDLWKKRETICAAAKESMTDEMEAADVINLLTALKEKMQ
jgi:hypothetical protein